nr:ankyrin repeat domain-containing protein [Wolbachia endosymbiont of Mansonella perstans]
MIVELLLKKKVNVNTRVKDGSKDDGPTALHIAASYGHKNMVEQLLKDDRVNPLLKSKNKTPKDMVGDASNKNTLVEMLEIAEKNYSLKKAKDLNIKIEGRGCYHLAQNNHKTQASLTANVGNVTFCTRKCYRSSLRTTQFYR